MSLVQWLLIGEESESTTPGWVSKDEGQQRSELVVHVFVCVLQGAVLVHLRSKSSGLVGGGAHGGSSLILTHCLPAPLLARFCTQHLSCPFISHRHP